MHRPINTAIIINRSINDADMDGSDTSDTWDSSDIMIASGADGVYFENMRFGYQFNAGYRMNPHERRRFDIRRRTLSAEFEEQQFHQNIQYGADGSKIYDGDHVYLLEGRFQDRVTKIDYFHGFHFGVATAQLLDEDETDGYEEHHSLALNMVQLGWRGEAVHCITVLQRKWRNRQWRLYVQPELIQLANDTLMQVSSV